MPSRRALLASLGVAAAAGCLDAGGSTGTPANGTASVGTTRTDSWTDARQVVQIGEAVDLDGSTVTVERVSVQDSLTYLAAADSMDVMATSSGRYVLAAVTVSGESPPATAGYDVHASGQPVASADPDLTPAPGTQLGVLPYDAEEGGWLGFVVEAPVSAGTASVGVRGARWRLPDPAVAHLNRPLAEFELVELAAPAEVGPDEPFEATVTVENVGDVDGTFRGVLNAAGGQYAHYPYDFSLDVSAGERATWRKAFPGDMAGMAEPGDEMSLHLRTAESERDRTVEVVAGTAAGTATESG